MESRQEYERILDNPEHVILSKELHDLLEDEPEKVLPKEEDSSKSFPFLEFDGQEYMFQVEKIKRLNRNLYRFTGLSPNFPVNTFIAGEKFSLQIFDSSFLLDEDQPIEYNSNGNLTFTARRIIKNEKVSI